MCTSQRKKTYENITWSEMGKQNIQAEKAPLIKSIFKISSNSTPPLAPLPEELPLTETTQRFVSGVSI